MLMGVKNQIKVTIKSIKYSIMREMINKASFITKVLIMILNDATCIVQWIILYSIKDSIGGYSFEQVLILWGLAAGSFGISRFAFKNAFHISNYITDGKLDSYLVQPKNVLLGVITSDSESNALGDILYGYIMLFVSGITLRKFFLFTLLTWTGGIISTSLAIILGSLSFWIKKSDAIAETGSNLMINFATYPDGIFSGTARALLYSLVPVGFSIYIPVRVISEFNITSLCSVLSFTVIITTVAVIVFYKGLKRYSSSNLMIAKI